MSDQLYAGKINKLGRCIQCDAEIYHSKMCFPLDHPLRGETTKVGAAKPNARRVTILLLDGSIATFTTCKECAKNDGAELDIPAIKSTMMRSWMREASDDYRKLMGLNSLNAQQKARMRKWLNKQGDNFIVGVLKVESIGEKNG